MSKVDANRVADAVIEVRRARAKIEQLPVAEDRARMLVRIDRLATDLARNVAAQMRRPR